MAHDSEFKSGRRSDRAVEVRKLNRVARACEVHTLADNAARHKVEKLAADLLARDLPEADADLVRRSLQAYQASFARPEASLPVAQPAAQPRQPRQEDAAPSGPTYKFQAVQLTYNSSAPAFLSQDLEELQALWERFKAFLASLGPSLSAIGVSGTMERASLQRVHLHAYMHLAKPFHRRGANALDVFVFEGARPHVEPNKASAKSYMGAVKFGHFYVVCNKKGTLYLGRDLGTDPD